MSDYIPFEIQAEIMVRLPVKSLIQCRSVSKRWRSLIDSYGFIFDHSLHHIQQELLIVSYKEHPKSEYKYVSFMDDDTFPLQKFDLTVPMSVKLLHNTIIVGSSHGLLCVFGYLDDTRESFCLKTGYAVIWNPSIRKSVLISVPYQILGLDEVVLGFGVCPATREPKIVMINRLNKWGREVKTDWEIKVYTLNSRKWRILSNNLPRNSLVVVPYAVVVDRFIYWLAFDTPATVAGLRRLILSFDITHEVFSVIDLPDRISHECLYISKLRESVILLEYNQSISTGNEIWGVWMMEHGDGVQISFTKLFTIETPYATITALGFRKNGDVLMEANEHHKPYRSTSAFVSFDPSSTCINDIGISATYNSFTVNSYVETLLLLNHSACDSY